LLSCSRKSRAHARFVSDINIYDVFSREPIQHYDLITVGFKSLNNSSADTTTTTRYNYCAAFRKAAADSLANFPGRDISQFRSLSLVS